MGPAGSGVGLLDTLYFHSQTLCDCLSHLPVEELATSANKQTIAQVITEAAAGNTGAVTERMMAMYAENYVKAVNSVYNSPKYGERGFEHYTRFVQNVEQMAAYKAKQLAGELDTLRGNPDFDKLAAITIKKYNRYQAVEYNTITARCRSAKQWERFMRERKLYPNIEWLRTRSSSPREKHLAYVGLILPQDDTFWNENQPGNLYGCKCDWRSTDKLPTTGIQAPATPSPGLEGNPYYTYKIFTDNHPYFANGNKVEVNRAMAAMKPEATYVETKTADGKPMQWNIMHKDDVLMKNLEVANDLVDNEEYDNVKILPDIHPKDAALRKPFLPDGYVQTNPAKNPEAIIYKDGQAAVAEFKLLTGERNLTKRLNDAAEQADIAVVKLKFGDVDKSSIIRRVDHAMAENKKLKGVIVLDENGKLIYKRL